MSRIQTRPAASRRTILLWSIGLYAAACVLPALILHVRSDLGVGRSVWGAYRSESGFKLLVNGLAFGWLRMNFTAFANPFLWVSWIMVARGSLPAARTLSLAALIVSAETLQLVIQPMLWDEAATEKGFLVAPHIGFIFWIASMAVVLWGSSRVSEPEAAR